MELLIKFLALVHFQKCERRIDISIPRTSCPMVGGFSTLTLLTFKVRQFIGGNCLEHHRMFSYIPGVPPLNTSSTPRLIVTTGFPARNHPVENHCKRLSSSIALLKGFLLCCWTWLRLQLLLSAPPFPPSSPRPLEREYCQLF